MRREVEWDEIFIFLFLFVYLFGVIKLTGKQNGGYGCSRALIQDIIRHYTGALYCPVVCCILL